MPHFFLPIDWVLAPSIIIFALLITTALMYWAVPELKFPKAPKSPSIPLSSWTHISESLLLSMLCTFVFQTKSFEIRKE